MGNKMRDRKGYIRQLDRYHLSRTDILSIEKILRDYADTREMKIAGVSSLPYGRKHMPRAAVDRYISIGRYRPFHLSLRWNEFGIHFAGVDWIYYEDSAKFLFLRKYPRIFHYIEIGAWPGLKITFTPLSTIIYAQTHYATGLELKSMKKTVGRLEEFLAGSPKSIVNNVSFYTRKR